MAIDILQEKGDSVIYDNTSSYLTYWQIEGFQEKSETEQRDNI